MDLDSFHTEFKALKARVEPMLAEYEAHMAERRNRLAMMSADERASEVLGHAQAVARIVAKK